MHVKVKIKAKKKQYKYYACPWTSGFSSINEQMSELYARSEFESELL